MVILERKKTDIVELPCFLLLLSQIPGYHHSQPDSPILLGFMQITAYCKSGNVCE